MELELPIKLNRFAERMRDHIRLYGAEDGALWDNNNTGYLMFASRMQDKEGRELGWILTASIDPTTREGQRVANCGKPDSYLITGTGIKPRLFPTLNSVLKALVGAGCANFVVLAD